MPLSERSKPDPDRKYKRGITLLQSLINKQSYHWGPENPDPLKSCCLCSLKFYFSQLINSSYNLDYIICSHPPKNVFLSFLKCRIGEYCVQNIVHIGVVLSQDASIRESYMQKKAFFLSSNSTCYHRHPQQTTMIPKWQHVLIMSTHICILMSDRGLFIVAFVRQYHLFSPCHPPRASINVAFSGRSAILTICTVVALPWRDMGPFPLLNFCKIYTVC